MLDNGESQNESGCGRLRRHAHTASGAVRNHGPHFDQSFDLLVQRG